MWNQHVLAFSDFYAVDENIRKRINRIKSETQPLAILKFRGCEFARIQPLIPFIWTKKPRIHANLQWRQDTSIHQIKFTVARHRCLDALQIQPIRKRKRTYRAVIWLGEIVQPPFAIKRNGLCRL